MNYQIVLQDVLWSLRTSLHLIKLTLLDKFMKQASIGLHPCQVLLQKNK